MAEEIRFVTREEVERDKRRTLLKILVTFILAGVLFYFLIAASEISR